MPKYFTDDNGVDWVKADEVDNDYETYVKYIVVKNTGLGAFENLAHHVNRFIENEEDSFVLEGPIQIGEHYIVQTLMNEDEM